MATSKNTNKKAAPRKSSRTSGSRSTSKRSSSRTTQASSDKEEEKKGPARSSSRKSTSSSRSAAKGRSTAKKSAGKDTEQKNPKETEKRVVNNPASARKSTTSDDNSQGRDGKSSSQSSSQRSSSQSGNTSSRQSTSQSSKTSNPPTRTESKKESSSPPIEEKTTIKLDQSVAILIDGNNIEMSLHSVSKKTSTMINFDKLVPTLLGNRALSRLIYFREGKSISPKLAERLQKLFHGSVVPCHKSADIPLSIKAVQVASKVDTIIILSGDADYVELVRHLKHDGIRVEIAAFPETTADILRQESDYFFPITVDYSFALK